MSKMSKEYELAIKIAGKVDSSLGSAIGSAQTALSKLGDFAGTVAKATAAAVSVATAAAVAFAKSAVDAGMEFDSAISQVAATMGTTTDQVGALRDFALEMGSKTAFSATEAAEALNYMALAGYDAETSMAMLPNVLNLAAAGAIDLASASDMITDAQSALGLTLDQTSAMVDQMAAASSKSNTSVAQLGEAILTVGGTAQYMAGGTQELNTVLGVLADNGIKGSEGGTHLRNMLLKLASPTADATKLINDLGVQIFDAQGNMRSFAEIFPELNAAMSDMTDQERLDAMSTLFNSRDIASATALLSTTTERWEELGTAIDGAWVNMDSMAKALSGVGMDLTAMQGNLSQLGIDGDAFSKMLNDSGGNAEVFADSLWEAAQAGVSYQDIVNALGGDLGNLQAAFDNTSGAAAAMAATQLDNLAGDITLFQSALEGAQIALSDQLTPSIREFVQFGTNSISTLSDAFKEGGLSGALGALGDILSDGLSMVIAELPAMIDAGMQLLSAFGQGLMDNLPMIINAALDVALMFIDGLVAALPRIADAAIEIITTLANGLSDALPGLVPSIVDVILQFCEMLTNPDALTALFDAALKIMAGLAQGLIKALPRLLEAIPTILANLAVSIVKALPLLLAALGEIFGPIGSRLGGTLSGVWKGIKAVFGTMAGWFDGIFAAVWGGIKNAAAAGLNAIRNSVSAFFGKLDSLTGGAVTRIAEFFSGLGDGIKTLWSGAAVWFQNTVITPIVNFFSPIIETIGGIFRGLWIIVQAIWAVAADWFSSSVITPIVNFFAPIVATVGGFFSSLWSGIQGTWATVSGWFDTVVVQPLVGFFAAIPGAVGEFFTSLWASIQAIWFTVSSWFDTTVVQPIIGFFAPIVEQVGGFFSNLWANICTVWQAAGSWFSDNVAAPIQNAFQAVGDFVKSVFNGIIGFVESMINSVVGGINKFIGGFSGVVEKAAGFLGIEWGGISEVPSVSLPRLAKGGIVTAPTLLEAGEAGDEAIIPLPELWGNMQDMIAATMNGATDGIAALADRLDAADVGASNLPIEDLLNRLDNLGNGNDPDDGNGPPPMQIIYSPTNHYHFEGEAPSKEDIAGAESMSQDEFDRMMAQWLKDQKRKNFRG